MTRTCPQCKGAFEPKRPHARFCSDRCRAIDWKQNNGEAPGERVPEHPLDEVRAQHEESKGRWTTIVREHLNRTLTQTGYVSAEDFEALGIPDEHRNLANAQMGGYASAGYIEAVMFRRWSTEKKASRKSGKYWIYKLTQKGREKLAGLATANPEGPDASCNSQALDRPGGFRRSASAPSDGAGSSRGGEPGEKQRGRDRQVRAAGSDGGGIDPADNTGWPLSDSRRNTQPGRLSDSSDQGTAGVRSDDLLGGDGSNRALAPVAADSGGAPAPPDKPRDPSACASEGAPPAGEGSAGQLFELGEVREKPRSAITDPDFGEAA